MKTLNIQGSADKPKVYFDNSGRLFMGGSSLPENPKVFFDPIMHWLEEYKANANMSTDIQFRFDYLNTASTNMMARIIESLSTLTESRNELTVTWFYEHGDYDIRELGEELLEDTDIKYSIIELEN